MTNNQTGLATNHMQQDEGVAKEMAPLPLEGFYLNQSATANKFLMQLAKQKTSRFDVEDRNRTLEILEGTDPFLQRTLALAQRSLTFKSGALAGLIISWVGQIMTADLARSGAWDLHPTETAQEAFNRVCEILKPNLHEKKNQRRAANQLILAMIWLATTRQLDAVSAASTLYSVSHRQQVHDVSVHQLNRAGIAFLSRTPVKLTSLRALLDFIQLWVIRGNAAHAEAQRRATEAESAIRELKETREQLEQLRREKLSLEGEHTDLNRSLVDATETLRGEKITSTHALADTRARHGAFLSSLLERYFGAAIEASRMEPPRLGVIRERVELASEAIEKELKWLKSLD